MESHDQSAPKQGQGFANKSRGSKNQNRDRGQNQSNNRGPNRGSNNHRNDQHNKRKPQNTQTANADVTPTQNCEERAKNVEPTPNETPSVWDNPDNIPEFISGSLHNYKQEKQNDQHLEEASSCDQSRNESSRNGQRGASKRGSYSKPNNNTQKQCEAPKIIQANDSEMQISSNDKELQQTDAANQSNNVSLIEKNVTSININVDDSLDKYWSNDAKNFKTNSKIVKESSAVENIANMSGKNHNTSRLQDSKFSNNSSKMIKETNRKPKNVDMDKSNKEIDTINDLEDITYEIYERKYKKSKMNDSDFKRVQEIKGDLFSAGKEYALAHCVAEDMDMGSGIAVQFRREFQCVPELLQQRQGQGGVAFIVHEGRYIFYLVTKRESSKKPTLDTMFRSIHKLKNLMVEHKVKKLSIPRIGCGLDRLEWSEVRRAIEYIFSGTDIDVLVWIHQQEFKHKEDHSHRKCAVKIETYPITAIGEYTIILYLGSEDGFVTDEIRALDKKFPSIMSEYRDKNPGVGKFIHSDKLQGKYRLYGCIVKKRKNDLFDFIHFKNCIKEINKINDKLKKTFNKYEYVGIQCVNDPKDDLLTNKIRNMMSNILHSIQVHICAGPLDL